VSGLARAGMIHELVDRRADADGERIGIRDPHAELSFAGLAERSLRWANWLHDRGVRRGARVLTVMDNSAEVPALLFGASRLGAITVSVNPQTRPFHLSHIVAETEPAVIVSDRPPDGMPASLVIGAQAARAEVDTADARLPAGPAPRPSDPAVLIYTSGSTAMPKGVACPHEAMRFAVEAISQRLGYAPGDRVLCCLPLAFDYGLYQVFLSVRAGCALILDTPDLGRIGLLDKTLATSATVVPLLPTLAASLIAMAARKPPAGHAVRLFTNTGAALAPGLCRRLRALFPGAAVTLMFGLTECKRVTIADPDADLERPDTVGTALPGTEVTVRDEQGQPLEAGAAGEIVVRGPHVMSGYWRNPELTASRFRRDPATGEVLLFTGDYGVLDKDGHLSFAGRRDDVYKQNGMRVSVAEVEAAASDIEGVVAVAAVPPDGERPATLFAVTSLTAAQILSEMLLRLEPPKVPKACVILDRLPVTAVGKVDRAALLAWGRR
jgi:acyl-CoA synthetase (AMP-forming)/AMP-acid ligase II